MLSVCSRTRQGCLRDSSAAIAAISSMRLLVVAASPPISSFSWSPQRSSTPQPPGPGLPEQAPSVKMSMVFVGVTLRPGGSIDAVGAGALDAAVEIELVEIFERVLRLDQR